MTKIFISHSHSDAPKISVLAELLVSQGIVVMRPDELVQEAEWHAEILSSIRRCSIFVAFISDEPMPNVMLELGYALGAGIPVILVRRPESRIPFDVAALPVIEFDEHDPGSLFAIVEAIRSKARADMTKEEHFQVDMDRIDYVLRDSESLEQLSPRDFESTVLALLQKLGFDAEQMPPTHDGGYDILIKDPRTSALTVVEVKKYQRNGMVGVAQVCQLLGAMTVSNASSAILITNSQFSASARDMAKRAPRPLLLMTLGDLVTSTRETITKLCS
jgi:hypothetical protein